MPGLPADWHAAPLGESEYQHYTRHVEGYPDDGLIATTRVCDCTTTGLFKSLEAAVGNIPAVHVTRAPAQACDRTVDHYSVSGLADSGRRNVDMYAFRMSGSLVVIAYFSSKYTPSADDESFMRALCPGSQQAA